jgi:hypothetical protein
VHIHSALFLSVTLGLSTHNFMTGAISNVIGTSVGTHGLGSQGGSSGAAGAAGVTGVVGIKGFGVCGFWFIFII